MSFKRGYELSIGDTIFIGLGGRVGRIDRFDPHPGFKGDCNELTARIAVTDIGRVTIVDDQIIRIPAQAQQD